MANCYLCGTYMSPYEITRRVVPTGWSSRVSFSRRSTYSASARTGLRNVCFDCAAQLDARQAASQAMDRRIGAGCGLLILLVAISSAISSLHSNSDGPAVTPASATAPPTAMSVPTTSLPGLTSASTTSLGDSNTPTTAALTSINTSGLMGGDSPVSPPQLPVQFHLGKVITDSQGFTALGGHEFSINSAPDPVSTLPRSVAISINPDTKKVYQLHAWQAYPTPDACQATLHDMQARVQTQYKNIEPATDSNSFLYQQAMLRDAGFCKPGPDGHVVLHRLKIRQDLAPDNPTGALLTTPVTAVATTSPLPTPALPPENSTPALAAGKMDATQIQIDSGTPYRTACGDTNFPSDWSAAQKYVGVLQDILRHAELAQNLGDSQVSPFQVSLGGCTDQAEREYQGRTGEAWGIYHCQARMICGRLQTLMSN